MGLYRACFRVQDGEYRYIMKRWIEAGDIEAAQEIARKWVEVINTDSGEYRGHELRSVDGKETVIEQIRNVDKGMTSDSVDNLLNQVKKRAF